MAKAYDSTGKYLIEAFPADWLALLGLGAGRPVTLIDANLSTVTAEADKVIRLGGEEPCLAHLELQTGRDVRLPARHAGAPPGVRSSRPAGRAAGPAPG